MASITQQTGLSGAAIAARAGKRRGAGLTRVGRGARLAIAAGGAVLLAGGGILYMRRPEVGSAARVTTTEVAVGKMTSTVSANGTVASPTQARLNFKVSGRVKEVLVSVGDQVVEGQPLARIDDLDFRIALSQAQANLASAQARLDLTRNGSRPEELDAARAQVDVAQSKVNEARTAQKGPEITAAESQLETARIRLRQLLAGARLEDVTAGQSQLDAATARLHALLNPRAEDIAAAEAALDAATQRQQVLLKPRPQDLTAAQSALDSAKIKLQQLQNPRAEDIRAAEAALAQAKSKQQQLLNPRPEDIRAAEAAVEQQRARLAAIVEEPIAAKPEDIANAELQVRLAQANLDKANADAADPSKAGIGGFSLSEQAVAAAVQQAELQLQQAQNTLKKLQTVGPTTHDQRAQSQALEQAQANLDKLRNPSPEDKQGAQAAVDQAQATLDKIKSPSFYDVATANEAVKQAQANLDRLLTPSPADLASAQQAVVSAQTTLEKLRKPATQDIQAAQQAVVGAQTALEKMRVPYDPDVQAAQQAVAQAEANLDRLRNSTTYAVQQAEANLRQAQATLDLRRSGATQQDVQMAAATVDQATAQVQQARANLDAATLVAPFTGAVGAVAANVGEIVSATSPVPSVTLIDTRQMRVDVAVDETDVGKLQPGQIANLTFDAMPGVRVPGKVDIIAPVAVIQQGVVTYPVQIQVNPAEAPGVRAGMTAVAAVVIAAKDDAVLVPNRALKMSGENVSVDVLDATGRVVPRPVKTGMANDELTEIVAGVQPGDRVVLPKTALDSTLPPQGTFGGTAGVASGAAGASGAPAAGGAATGPAGLGPRRSSQ